MDEPTTLAEVIDRAYAKHQVTSSRKLAAVSKELGVPISYTTLSEMRRGGYHWDLTPDLRERLHRLSGVSRDVIDRLTNAPTDRFELPPSADHLTGDQREAVLGVVRAFAKANRTPRREDEPIKLAAHERGGPSAPMHPPGGRRR